MAATNVIEDWRIGLPTEAGDWACLLKFRCAPCSFGLKHQTYSVSLGVLRQRRIDLRVNVLGESIDMFVYWRVVNICFGGGEWRLCSLSMIEVIVKMGASNGGVTPVWLSGRASVL